MTHAHITRGVDTWVTGAQKVVNRDSLERIPSDASSLQIQPLDIRDATDTYEHAVRGNRAGRFVILGFQDHARARRARPDYARIEKNVYAVARHRSREYLRGIPFFARQELRFILDDGDFRAQATERLGEFAAQRTAAYDRELLGQLREFEDGLTGDVGALVEARNAGGCRDGAGRHERFLESEARAIRGDGMGIYEMCCPKVHVHAASRKARQRMVAGNARLDFSQSGGDLRQIRFRRALPGSLQASRLANAREQRRGADERLGRNGSAV